MINKISIVGAPGTGKTTLSNNLSKLLNIEATHLDGIHHLPNWEIRDKKERDEIILNKIKEPKWIIDGTYKDTIKARAEAADLVIWLDFSTYGIVRGVLGRYFKNKGVEKPEIPGCKEKMDKEFFTYCLKYRKNKRHFTLDAINSCPSEKVVILKNRRQVNKWLKEFSAKIDEEKIEA